MPEQLKSSLFSSKFNILSFAPRAGLLFLLMALAAMTEGFGLMLLVPILGMLSADNSVIGPLKNVWAFMSDLGLPNTAGALIFAFLILVIMRCLIQLYRDRLSVRLRHQFVDELRIACFTALLHVEWRWLITSRNSDQANLLLTDINRVGIGLQFGAGFLVSALTIFVYLITAFTISWKMALVALISGIILFAVIFHQSQAAQRMGEMLSSANRALHTTVENALSGIKLTKIFGNENLHLRRLNETMANARQQQVSFLEKTALSRAIFQIGGATLLASYLYVGLTYLKTPAAELLTLIFIFTRLTPLLITTQQQFQHFLHAYPAFKDSKALLQECRIAAEPLNNENIAIRINHNLILNNITVRYAGRSGLALDNISFSIPAKTTTAIIGHSGAGKSTLADVLIGLLTPDLGNLQIDDEIISGNSQMQWRNSVAYVPQEVYLFHDTIRNNLLWGNPKASDKELNHALQVAAADFVHGLPDGLHAVVGDAGVRLSGGERQRIALARALLRKPTLLILDEATSALDLENEARIRDAIESLHGDLTVIIIGHRLMTLEHADQVIKMSNGRIKQIGSWEMINAKSDY